MIAKLERVSTYTVYVANNNGADQTARMRRLLRTFVVRIHEIGGSRDEAQINATECIAIGSELFAKKKLFVAFPWVETSTGPGGFMICVFINMTGTPEGSTESGFMEKPGIEPATPGLQGIALIHYTTGASLNCLLRQKITRDGNIIWKL